VKKVHALCGGDPYPMSIPGKRVHGRLEQLLEAVVKPLSMDYMVGLSHFEVEGPCETPLRSEQPLCKRQKKLNT